MTVTFPIVGPNQWELLYSEIVEATDAEFRSFRLNGRYLDPFDIPILVESEVIAVRVTSVAAKSTWYRAGSVIQYVENPSFPGYVPTAGATATTLALVERKLVTLNQAPDVLVFQKFASTTRFAFDPMPWIPQLQIQLWEYQGTPVDTVLDGQEDIKAKLDIIDAKVTP